LNELSGHLLLRTGGLVVLTLVATTLPAEAIDLAVPASDARTSDSTSDARPSDAQPSDAQPPDVRKDRPCHDRQPGADRDPATDSGPDAPAERPHAPTAPSRDRAPTGDTSSDPVGHRSPGTPAPDPLPEKPSSSQGAGRPDMAPMVFRSAIGSGQESRYAEVGTGPSLLADLQSHLCRTFFQPADAPELTRIEAPRALSHAHQRCWLTCRDAHAPPVC